MSALENQLMIAAETTYGTYVAGARGLEFTGEGMALDIPRVESAGQRPGDQVGRSDHWMNGKRQAAGSFEFEVGNKGFGLLLDMALGTTTTTTDGTGKKHASKLGPLVGKSLSMQLGKSDVGQVIDPFTYVGCKLLGLTLTQEVEAYLMMAVDVDAQDEQTGTALATATAPALTQLFDWNMATISVAGSLVDEASWSIGLATPLKTDRFFPGRLLKKEPLRNGKRLIQGSLQGEFESLTAYNRFVSGTLVPIVMTWTSTLTYDTAKFFKLVVTLPSCRFDGNTPVTNGQDIIEQVLPFTVKWDGTNEPILTEYYTSDAAP